MFHEPFAGSKPQSILADLIQATLITPPTHSCRRHLIGNRLLRLQLLHLRVSHGGVRDTRWRGMQRQDVPGSEARGSGGRPASEEIDRDYLEYNDPARLDYVDG
ncbi:hypothetical protein MUK42_27242 [Musa troglodytarum]|uniref:Uncharacterized protein n=1 Tax=Musa troglodytarum TaxID=320322 RepID=A0A9E7EWM8_9LILI|nr:hypothetical protein MUK42_27242 [Musa troglodytarum]